MKIDRRDPFGAELRRLIDQLDQRQFKALSNGVGLGRARNSDKPKYANSHPFSFSEPVPFSAEDQFSRDESAYSKDIAPSFEAFTSKAGDKDRLSQSFMEPAWMPSSSEFTTQEFPPQTHSQEGVEQSVRQPNEKVKRGIVSRLFRFGIEHSIDLVTVLATLFVTLTGAAFMLAPWKGGMAATLMAWQPVQVILTLGLLQFIVAVYVLYFLYWVVFKVLVGSTFGQNCAWLVSRLFGRSDL